MLHSTANSMVQITEVLLFVSSPQMRYLYVYCSGELSGQ